MVIEDLHLHSLEYYIHFVMELWTYRTLKLYSVYLNYLTFTLEFLYYRDFHFLNSVLKFSFLKLVIVTPILQDFKPFRFGTFRSCTVNLRSSLLRLTYFCQVSHGHTVLLSQASIGCMNQKDMYNNFCKATCPEKKVVPIKTGHFSTFLDVFY